MKQHRARQDFAMHTGAKRSITLRVFGAIALSAFVFIGCATLFSKQQDVEPIEQDSVSSEAGTGMKVDHFEVDSAMSDGEADSIVEDAVDSPVVEDVVADLPVAPEIGGIAPSFELATINGETLALADLQGKPTFISFFHSY